MRDPHKTFLPQPPSRISYLLAWIGLTLAFRVALSDLVFLSIVSGANRITLSDFQTDIVWGMLASLAASHFVALLLLYLNRRAAARIIAGARDVLRSVRLRFRYLWFWITGH